MTKLELKIHDDIITTIRKIKDINDSSIELYIPEGCSLIDNILNIKIVKEQSEKLGINVQFYAEDEIGTQLIKTLEDGSSTSFIPDENTNIDERNDYGESSFETSKYHEESSISKTSGNRTLKLNLKNFYIVPLNFIRDIKSNLNIRHAKFLIPAVILVTLVIGYFLYGKSSPRAYAKIVVNSQPLTRSITIKVGSDIQTNTEDKTLKGQTLEAEIEDTLEIETTGEKIIGEKAKGEITLYNKTIEDIKLKKGSKIKYEDGIEYQTREDVTIEKKTETTSEEDPSTQTFKLGEATTEVEALEIGDKYNISKGKELDIKDYDSDELIAKSKEDFEGGKSETVKAVSQIDLDKLQTELQKQINIKAEDNLKNKVANSQKLIEGSTSIIKISESYNHQLNDQTDKVSLTQKVSSKGLVYSESELNRLLDKLVEDMIPEGFKLSEKDRSVQVSVLGNSTNSVLSSTQSDIQVTLKTFVVPNIDEQKLKEELKGKNITDAQKVLGGIRNIQTYEFNIKPVIPFFRKVPTDINHIELKVELK